ncbi:hypothetical protein HHK36_030498 [Tetracentron sinense]|uniref:Uncharacterized protein n=1 Tax=Tetracentron sinense TaxID=13715 RepID=A0A835CYS7_TETSI|nr:hypothetical protein HHK36_030498 [Tetracentron sinense]
MGEADGMQSMTSQNVDAEDKGDSVSDSACRTGTNCEIVHFSEAFADFEIASSPLGESLNGSQSDENGVYSAVFLAAELGIVEFIEEIVTSFPVMMLAQDEENQRNILQIAVVHRQERIFNFICGTGTTRRASAYVSDKFVTSSRKEVEKLVEPAYREDRNSEGKTPRALFTEQHKDLVKEGEKWMKETATACMVNKSWI